MKVPEHIEKLNRLVDEGEGVITTAAALREGISKSAFYRYVENRNLKRQSHGIYMTKDALPDEFALLQTRFPKTIFSHDTALFLHEMSEREPIPLSVSVESGYNSPALKGQGVRIHYVKPDWHELGICEVKTPEGNSVRAYDKERTVCDLIRKRAGADVTEFNQAMRAYVSSKDKNLAKLSEYARRMNMESKVWNAIGVLL